MGTTRLTPGWVQRVAAIFPAVLVAVFLAGSWLVGQAHAAASPGDVFTVADIPVDATANSALAAREAARTDGQRRAFGVLIERLTLAADRGRVPRLSDQQLTELVRDFEVANERSSAVRYLAAYTFRFRADDVRRLLRDAGVPFAETVSKPVIVLAVLRQGESALLWDDPNPWRSAWADRQGTGGLVPFIVPLGDAADVAAIGAEQALAAVPGALAAIAGHYDANDVLIATATQVSSGELKTTLRRVSGGRASEVAGATFQKNPGESEADFMGRAVTASAAAVQEAWRRGNVLDSGKEEVLTADVPLAGIADWVVVRERLTGVPAVKRSDLVTLGRQVARIEIHYLGDPTRLRTALEQRDLVLDGSDGSWSVRPRPGSIQAR
jgi:hypothetical protein